MWAGPAVGGDLDGGGMHHFFFFFSPRGHVSRNQNKIGGHASSGVEAEHPELFPQKVPIYLCAYLLCKCCLFGRYRLVRVDSRLSTLGEETLLFGVSDESNRFKQSPKFRRHAAKCA